MRIGKAAAAVFAGALLAAPGALSAAPLVNVQDGVRVPAGMVDLVQQRGSGMGFSGGRSGFGGLRSGGFGGMPSGRGSFGNIRSGGGATFGGGPRAGIYRGSPGIGVSRGAVPRANIQRGAPKMNVYRGSRYAQRNVARNAWAQGGKPVYGKRYAQAGKHKGRHHRRGRNVYPYIWPGIVAGAYGVYGYDECDWLYRRARATGSAYWWRRYEECTYYY